MSSNTKNISVSFDSNPKVFEFNSSFTTEGNKQIHNLKIVYNTYGTYIPNVSKVVWACHALTGNSDVFDWWSGVFGKNALFNPNEHFIICANVIGSSYGSTSSASTDQNGNLYLNNFPLVTPRDMAKAHSLLKNHSGINSVYTLIGASLGGQQAVEWAILEPTLFENLILVATNARHSAFGIAFNESQRLAIYGDPTYGKGTIEDAKYGLSVARSIAMISYRSYEGYVKTQTDEGNEKVENFRASSYQSYQGKKLSARFNAYSYVTLSKAMDSHNVGRGRESIYKALAEIKAKTLVIGIDSDYLFPLVEQKFLQENIKGAKMETISSDFGHDGFLVENEQLLKIIGEFIHQSQS